MKFVADDGKQFNTYAECVIYQRKIKEAEDILARIEKDLLIINEEVERYECTSGNKLRFVVVNNKFKVLKDGLLISMIR